MKAIATTFSNHLTVEIFLLTEAHLGDDRETFLPSLTRDSSDSWLCNAEADRELLQRRDRVTLEIEQQIERNLAVTRQN